MILVLLACGAPRPPAPPPPPPDLVLITLDTTRADRIGAYGYGGAHTPMLDALAARGRRYARAYSPVPLTIPAHASLLTARSPVTLGIRSNGAGRLDPSVPNLAAHLGAHGFATGAAVGAFVTSRTWGFAHGFDAFADDLAIGDDPWHAERPGAEVVDDALSWWSSVDGPRFLWVHLYDPHFPYRPPDPSVLPLTDHRPYDAELAYVDREVGRLLAGLGDGPRVVAVVGDHGEGLAEHGELTHGLFVYESTQRVPWILSGPGIAPGVVEQPVALRDVAPTLLELLGVPPLPGAEGRPVPGPPEPVRLEAWQLATRYGVAPHLAVVDGPWKLIATPRPELYDVVADPGETTDRAAEEPAVVSRLQALLGRVPPPRVDPAHPLPSAERAQLLALGYTTGGPVPDGPLPDPKDRRPLLDGVQRVERALLLHDWAAAEAELAGLVEGHPGIVEFTTLRATVLPRLGRADEAAPLVAQALGADPENAMLQLAHGNALLRAGDAGEAAPMLEAAGEALPFLPRIRARAVAVWVEAGRADHALALGERWLRDDPADAALAGVVAVQRVGVGRVAEALPLLELGVGAEPPAPDVAFHLAAARMGEGRPDESRRLLEVELRHYPGNHRALLVWARLAGSDPLHVAERAERALAVADGAAVRELAAHAHLALGDPAAARVHVAAGLAMDPAHAGLRALSSSLQ